MEYNIKKLYKGLNDMLYGYCRVNTKHQNLQRQKETLRKFGISDRFIFSDKYTRKTLNRDGLNELLEIVKRQKIWYYF